MSRTKTIDWIRVAKEYQKNGTVKECPACGQGDSVDVHVTHFGRISYTFLCRKCGAAAHIDGTNND